MHNPQYTITIRREKFLKLAQEAIPILERQIRAISTELDGGSSSEDESVAFLTYDRTNAKRTLLNTLEMAARVTALSSDEGVVVSNGLLEQILALPQ